MPNGLKPVCFHHLLGDQEGFTILELMMVLLVSGILAMLALPAMRQFLQNQGLSSAASELVSGLNYARSEAIKEDVSVNGGGGVRLCASTVLAPTRPATVPIGPPAGSCSVPRTRHPCSWSAPSRAPLR